MRPERMYCAAVGLMVTDLEMMKNPNWWPHVILPLIGGPEGLAVLAESGADREAGEESIYLFWPGQSMIEPLDMTKAVWLKIDWLPRIVELGWRVD